MLWAIFAMVVMGTTTALYFERQMPTWVFLPLAVFELYLFTYYAPVDFERLMIFFEEF